MAKKKSGPIIKKGLDEWMGTYSDCITLLFCFFVMLYALSPKDEVKIQYIMEAMATEGASTSVSVSGQVAPSEASSADSVSAAESTPAINSGQAAGDASTAAKAAAGEADSVTFEKLYDWLESTLSQSAATQGISAEAGGGRIRISFDNNVLFDPDRAIIKPEGQRALNQLAAPLRWANPLIRQIEVEGHTADAISDIDDWELSSARAATVVKFIDAKNIIESKKFIVEGYAKYRPADFLSPDSNRRVEIVITRNTVLPESTEELFDILEYDYNTHLSGINEEGVKQVQPTAGDNEVINSILDKLQDKYDPSLSRTPAEDIIGGRPSVVVPDQIGPSAVDDVTVIPDRLYEESAAETVSETD